jgi:DNA repair photolyase
LRLPDPVPIEAGTEGAYAIEIKAKSIINRVPGASAVPFRWTVNPYRGCGHACVYCFARRTHEYLDLDSGRDFDSKIVVKTNAGALLRKELASTRWCGEPIAMGTNTDPYQRAEGRYRLMREIVAALRDHANSFSILTKGTLILRDVDLITQAARVADVSIAVSVGSVDEALWRTVEPGTPSPLRRLDVVRRFTDVGIGCSVLMAPILPGLSDSADQIDETVAALAEAGASSVTPLVLHLRPGAREWYHAWLQREHPELLPLYERLYRVGAYPPASYQEEVVAKVGEAKRRHGMARRERERNFREVSVGESPAVEARSRQLSLI